jgi:hypothetical protein
MSGDHNQFQKPKSYLDDMNEVRKALEMALEALEGNCTNPVADPEQAATEDAAITALRQALGKPKYRRGDRLLCLETEEYCVIHISGTDRQYVKFPDGHVGQYTNQQVADHFELLPKEVDADETRPQARSLTDELMDCVDRLGSEADTVDPRVWQHLLVYAPKHEKEPVAWANSSDLQNFDMKVRTGPDLNHTVPLYTSPPKREWVGLTDEEVVGIGNASGLKAKPTSTGIIIHPDGIKNFFQAIEAKLREKNT